MINIYKILEDFKNDKYINIFELSLSIYCIWTICRVIVYMIYNFIYGCCMDTNHMKEIVRFSVHNENGSNISQLQEEIGLVSYRLAKDVS